MKGYVTVPVDLSVNRHYRIYVNVPEDAGTDDVRGAMMNYVRNNGLDDTDLDIEIPEIEESDINGFCPDWEGAWSSGEDLE